MFPSDDVIMDRLCLICIEKDPVTRLKHSKYLNKVIIGFHLANKCSELFYLIMKGTILPKSPFILQIN